MRLFWIFPINKRKIVFSSYHASKYACNPRCIYEELLSCGERLDMVWLLPADYPHKPNGARIVPEKSLRALYELSTARIWVDNCRKSIWTRKRKNQYYIQTWHAGISNKLGERFAEDKLPHEYIIAAKNDSKMADLFLSNSEWLTKNYRDCFWYDGEILENGLPREDILVGNHSMYHELICNYYGVSHNNCFLLYAPTFRKDGGVDCYDIDYKRLLNCLKKNGNDWKIIVRLHPNIQSKHGIIVYDEDVLDGSGYPEINELIMASEYFISDYSSCIFDAMLANCRVVLYASDMKEYEKDRGYAFNWNQLPFLITNNNDELESAILDFSEKEYYKKIEVFKKKCGMFKLGNATKAVSKQIIRIIRNEIT